MDDFITIYYWARLAVLALVTLVALFTAIRMSARRPFKLWREVVVSALTVALFVVASAVVGVHYGVVWAAVLVVLGLVVGYFANRGDRVTREDGRLMLRRSPVVPWLWFVAVVLMLATLLFAEAYLFSLSMLLLAFVMAAMVGQTVAVARASAPVAAGSPEASAA